MLAASAASLIWAAKSDWGDVGGTPAYQLARVDRGALVSTVSASGVLEAVDVVEIGSQLSGKIVAVEADYNSRVSTGDVVARIDPLDFAALVEEAEAELAIAVAEAQNARVNLEEAQTELGRLETLKRKNAVSDSELDKAQTTARSAQVALELAAARVRQREAALSRHRFNLERSVIRSPIDGIVIERAAHIGQTVAASLQSPTLFTVARDLRQMQVATSVDEADVGRIAVGQRALFSVDAFPGRRFVGEIVQVRKAPQVMQNVVTYTVIISASNDEDLLLPGMTANVTIVVSEKAAVVKVPNAALRFRPLHSHLASTGDSVESAQASAGQLGLHETHQTVWVPARDSTLAPIPVVAGTTDGRFTELLAGGLQAGDQVVVGFRDVSGR
jgi:HlyD family secretion protein